MEKRRYALRLAYDGNAFRGWQRQPGLPSVQEALEMALAGTDVRVKLDVVARTDAGVHALDQVVTFSIRRDIDPAALRKTVNAGTPKALLCLAAARVAPSFHARTSALWRRYVYLVGAPPPSSLVGYAWSIPDERAFPGVAARRLDIAAVRKALDAAVGEHDFAGFARPGERRGTIRTVTRAELRESPSMPLYAIVIEGKAFLRAMVRNLVGTSVAIGLGLAPPSRVSEILTSPGRYRGVRAPGWGLTLAAVAYNDGAVRW